MIKNSTLKKNYIQHKYTSKPNPLVSPHQLLFCPKLKTVRVSPIFLSHSPTPYRRTEKLVRNIWRFPVLSASSIFEKKKTVWCSADETDGSLENHKYPAKSSTHFRNRPQWRQSLEAALGSFSCGCCCHNSGLIRRVWIYDFGRAGNFRRLNKGSYCFLRGHRGLLCEFHSLIMF